MLIIDDILLFPVRSIMFLCREIDNAAHQEYIHEAEAIRDELRELYMMLETSRITEQEFEAREKELLDRLEETEAEDLNVVDELETVE